MSAESDHVVNQKLEESMNLAAHGDERAAREFFHAFLEGPLYVPERYQTTQLTNSPQYPNDFVNILAVQDRDRAVVPVFSNPELIQAWCGQPLSFRTLPAKDLLESMPEEWWLIVNPGCEIDKDISPWEVEQLREGAQGIPAIIEELFPSGLETVIEVEAPAENEYLEVRNRLQAFAAEKPEIEKLYLLIENGIDMDDNPTKALLVGAQAKIAESDAMNKLRDEIRSVVDLAMIGHSERVKVLIGADAGDNLVLGIFNNAQPFYARQQQGSVLSKILRAFTS